MSGLGPYRTPPKLSPVIEVREPLRTTIADELIERCSRLMRSGHLPPTVAVVSLSDYEDLLGERHLASQQLHGGARLRGGHPIIIHGPGGPVEVYVGNVDEPALGWRP